MNRGPEAATRTATGHVRALDGVRGLAILLVLILHLFSWPAVHSTTERVFAKVTSLGWIGVDLFFVLSGFLITGILLDARGDEHYFRNFYARRTLRIFPLYYLALVLFLVIAPAIGVFAPSTHHAWWWLYGSNIFLAKTQTWNAGPPNVAHFWSLAVEEQFYLVWPAVVYLASTRNLRRICLAVLVVAPLLRIALWMRGVDGIAGYVLMPTRADALAAGALVAIAFRTDRERLLRLTRPLAIASSAVLLVTLLVLRGIPEDRILMQAIGYSANAGLFAALVALAALGEPRVGRVFSTRALTTLGKYSYAIYVFHQPLIAVLARFGVTSESIGQGIPAKIVFAIAVFALTMIIALASWNLFEKHFLRLKKYFEAQSKPVSGDSKPEWPVAAAGAPSLDAAPR